MDTLGTYLRQERELRQISLEEVAQTTRIPLRMLQHLEGDDFDALPGEVFAKGFLRSYARTVGLPVHDVLSRFGDRGKKTDLSAPPLTAAVTPPERGRRFGIAIALVILLILFTLALSIVLRPRRRDTPVELSKAVPTSFETYGGAVLS